MSDLPPARRPPRWRDPSALQPLAYAVVVACGAWWLLGQLAAVFRPLLLAVFLCYVLLPWYARLRRGGVPAWAALAALAGLAVSGLGLTAAVASANLKGLRSELPDLQVRAVGLLRDGTGWLHANVPWLAGHANPDQTPEEVAVGAAADLARRAANEAAGGLVEAATAGLYLLFLLLGVEKLPDRVRAAYPPDQADRILHAAGRVNAAIIGYLRAKVKTSLALAVPVGVVLTAFDVRFAALWAGLTFACNFIPYVGSVVAFTLPVGFAFLQLPLGWQPAAVAGLLLACHVAVATLVEPTLIGRAVGLSPLVILAALAVWGQVWGLPGMFLAVPLTVVGKLVLDNLDLTRPFAKLLEG